MAVGNEQHVALAFRQYKIHDAHEDDGRFGQLA